MSTYFHSSLEHRESKLSAAARESDATDAGRSNRIRTPIYSRLFYRSHASAATRKRSRRFFS